MGSDSPLLNNLGLIDDFYFVDELFLFCRWIIFILSMDYFYFFDESAVADENILLHGFPSH